eukprot:symbB.v1.2.023581.t1/scaffold2167.1/size87172/8
MLLRQRTSPDKPIFRQGLGNAACDAPPERSCWSRIGWQTERFHGARQGVFGTCVWYWMVGFRKEFCQVGKMKLKFGATQGQHDTEVAWRETRSRRHEQ